MKNNQRTLYFRLLKRSWIPLVAILIIYLALLARAAWNQEMTLHLETPAGILQASSVSMVKFKASPSWLSHPKLLGSLGASHTAEATGEAVVAKLGQQYLFALLDGANTKLYYSWPRPKNENISYRDAVRHLQRQKKPMADQSRFGLAL